MKITSKVLRDIIKRELVHHLHESDSDRDGSLNPGELRDIASDLEDSSAQRGRSGMGHHSDSAPSPDTAGDHFIVSREDLQGLLTVANDLNMAALGNPDERAIRAAMDRIRKFYDRLLSKGPHNFGAKGGQQ